MRRLVVLAVVVLAACGGDDGGDAAPEPTEQLSDGAFETPAEGTVDDVTAALEAQNLTLCDAGGGGSDALGAYDGVNYNLMVDGACPSGTMLEYDGFVSINSYTDQAALQSSSEQAMDSVLRARWGQFLIAVGANSHPDVIDAVDAALGELGATVGYDGRL